MVKDINKEIKGKVRCINIVTDGITCLKHEWMHYIIVRGQKN